MKTPTRPKPLAGGATTPKCKRSPRRQRPTILVIDDAVEVRLILRELLEHRFNAKVAVATSNKQAFAAAKRQEFDLVMSDYSRTGGDGLTFLREFKALYPQIPVVIHSGSTQTTRQRARRLGASACIQKTISVGRLLRIIERVLFSAHPEKLFTLPKNVWPGGIIQN